MSSAKCPDCLSLIKVCRELGACGRPALKARRLPEPNYTAATDDQLRQLAEHATEARVRANAGKALRARGKRGRPEMALDGLVAELARIHLRIETLETRNSDSLDFHDCGVASIKSALEAAYQAGLAAGKRSSK